MEGMITKTGVEKKEMEKVQAVTRSEKIKGPKLLGG